MCDPKTVSERLFRASPNGRLEHLEAVLQEMLAYGEDAGAHFFSKYVVWAREALLSGRMTDVLHYIAKADLALTLIDYTNDPDRIRGVKTLDAAMEGGKARKSIITEEVIAEMKRILERGGSISWAAKTAFTNKVGTSTSANRAIWYRYSREK